MALVFLASNVALSRADVPKSRGPNAWGTLVVHDTGLGYTYDTTSYPSTEPTGCPAGIDNNVSVNVPAGKSGLVWKVYAAFLGGSSPRLKALAFGEELSPGCVIFAGGVPDPATDFELPQNGWPNTSGGGVAISFGFTKLGLINEVYWFGGYSFYADGSDWFRTTTHPVNSSIFVDDGTPPAQDPIAGYSSIGFGAAGVTVCPAPGIPLGGCCYPDGSCVLQSELECQTTGGFYRGDTTNCDPNLCPQPEGACCMGDGTCYLFTRFTCASNSGAYHGDETSCAPNPCGLPSGACCLSSGACEILFQDGCEVAHGTFAGAAEPCTAGLCDDEVPPAAVQDLQVEPVAGLSIAVHWTAPGDDGDVGTAEMYDLRYSTSPIDSLNWASCTQVSGEPDPLIAGSAQSVTVSGLQPSTAYYFALKTRDLLQWSALSNIATTVTFPYAIYVRPDGLGTHPTIQMAIDAATAGQSVVLADGTFRGNYDRLLNFHGKAITVRSESDHPETCIIDCEGSASYNRYGACFISGETNETTLRGVTIRNGYNPFGAGIFITNSSPQIRNCRFENNRSQASVNTRAGGAISINGVTSAVVDSCFFLSNSAATYGGAVMFYNSSGALIKDCVFRANTAALGGEALDFWASSATVRGCTFRGNGTSANSATVYGYQQGTSSVVTLDNCTFVGAIGSGAVSGTGCDLRVGRSVFSQCSGRGVRWINGGAGSIECTDIYGNTGGDWVSEIAAYRFQNGNLWANPLFCSTATDTLRVNAASMCLDANNPGCGSIGAWGAGCSEPAIGACCAPNGTCTAVLSADCSGTWLGGGVICEPGLCPDIMPPAAVGDLVAGAISASAVELMWTAPGDDGSAGTATEYDLRYSTEMLTEASWASAMPAPGEPAPALAGTGQSMTVNGLTVNVPYYFGLKTRDEVTGQWSALSNVPSATPGYVDFVVTGAVTVNSDTTFASVDVRTGGVLTANGSVTVLEDMVVRSGGLVTHALRHENGLRLTVGDSLRVDSGGVIDLNGKGLRGGNNGSSFGVHGEAFAADGSIVSGANGSSTFGAGASHGGRGGSGTVAANTPYGRLEDALRLGAGGGGGGSRTGGHGGGRAVIVATTCVLNGTVRANGSDGTSGSGQGGGGGAGGSIRLEVGGLAGSGLIEATGGHAGSGSSGSGGGGRIAIFYDSMSLPGGNLHAWGAHSGSDASPGSIYLKPSAAPSGDLLVDNLGATSALETPLLTGLAGVRQLSIRNGARLSLSSGDLAALQVEQPILLPAGTSLTVGAGVSLNVSNGVGFDLETQGGTVTLAAGSNLTADHIRVGGTGGVLNTAINLSFPDSGDFELAGQSTVNVQEGAVLSLGTFGPWNIQSGVLSLASASRLEVGSDRIDVGSGVTLVKDGVFGGLDQIGSFVVEPGGTLTHSARSEAGLRLEVRDTLRVHGGSPAGKINLDGKGLRGGNNGSSFGIHGEAYSPAGSIVSAVNGSATFAGGASHGGRGGSGAVASNEPYGWLEAAGMLGAGGGGGGTQVGGHGGGRATILAETCIIDGVVSANGADGSASGGQGGGGGAGGSIRLQVGHLSGLGAIEATGGHAGSGSSGSGSGGRLSVECETTLWESQRCHAWGAYSGNDGSAGTIYSHVAGLPQGDLIIDNLGAVTSLSAPLLTQLAEFSLIHLRNRGNLSHSGAWTQSDGVIRLEGNCVFTSTSGLLLAGGTLEGVGIVAGSVDNAGVLAPGLMPQSPTGTLTIQGAYSQQNAGRVELQISGTQAGQRDLLAIQGAGVLGGTAAFEFLNGFDPALSDSFTVMTAASLASAPDSVEGADAACLRIRPTAMVLRCRQSTQAPETFITLGPAEGSHTNAQSLVFGWTGRDNQSPAGALVYARSLDAGAWSSWAPDTTYAFANMPEGAHTLHVKSKDPDAFEDPTPATRSFTVDRTAPVSTITSGPLPNGWTTGSVTFVWQGADAHTPAAGLLYSFRRDDDAWSTYAAGNSKSYSGLAAGAHLFQVRSRDLAGNEETPPVTRAFRVDLEAPETEITSGPSPNETILVDHVAIGWIGSDGQVSADSLTYQWALDAGSWSNASSATQATLVNLADGLRTFRVRARDFVGNLDPTPDTLKFRVDADGPTVSFTSAPTEGQHLPQSSVSFAWTAIDANTPRPGLEFAWRRNGAQSDWSADTSTVLAALAEGSHVFDALSRDERGWVGAATRHFTVDLTDPETEILTGPADSSWVTTSATVFTWRGSDNLSLPSQLSYAWRLDDGSWSTYSSVSSATVSGITSGDHLFQVRSRDLSGRFDPAPAVRFFHMGVTDLVVTNVTLPAIGNFDRAVPVQWSVSNQGPGPALGGWTDRVSLSADDQPGGDQALQEFVRPTSLAAGESYDQIESVVIPVHAVGDYWIVVETDVLSQMTEQGGEANNRRVSSQPIHLSIPDHPDLRVEWIAAPTEGWAGQGLDVTWRVFNNGGSAAEGGWKDRVYLSSDAAIGNDVLLSTFNYPEGLGPTEGYEHVHPLTLPTNLSGPQWLIVVTDAEDRIEEYGEEVNNATMRSESIFLHELQYPDLLVESITGPESAIAGSPVEVRWVVHNVGAEPTDAPVWHERVLLSPEPHIVPGATYTLGTVLSQGYLPPGASHQNSAEVVLPTDIAGTYYFLVQVDVNLELNEGSGEYNNVGVATDVIGVTLMNPFLRVTSVQTQLYGWSGEIVDITWTVRNVGEATFTSTHWDDGVVLSVDRFLDPEDLTIGSGFYHESPLGTGETDTLRASVRLPVDVAGELYLFVVPNLHQVDNVHGLPGSDSLSVTQAPPPDLEVTALAAPDSVASGSSLAVDWAVTNQALSVTGTESWRDALYLSADPVHDPGIDLQLGSWTIEEYLPPDGSYTRSVSVPVPGSVWGTYFLLLCTDVLNQVDEGAWETNNCRVYGPVDIYVMPANLRVAGITGPEEAWSGQIAAFSYNVANTGTGAVPAVGWLDRVYLSADSVLSVGGDVLVATLPHSGPLLPGAQYANQVDVTPPAGASGPWHLFVSVDATDAVFEYGGEPDNLTRQPFVVQLTPPPDLQVNTVLPDTSAWSGEALAVGWSVSNHGPGGTVVAAWRDLIYLSSDSVYQASEDWQVGAVDHQGVLGSGESYESQVSVAIPEGAEGSHWILLQTDGQNAVYEHDSENNNFASGQVDVHLTPPPDLQVSEVIPLNAAWSADTLFVRWTVRNGGAGSTRTAAWRDELFTSMDSTFTPGTDSLVMSHTHTGVLAPGATYSVTGAYVTPVGLSGDRHFFVRTDVLDQVYEHGVEGNNTGHGVVPVQLTPPPDLRVTAGAVVTECWDADTVRVVWTVTNVGTGGTVAGLWTDALYLSTDSLYQSEADALGATRAHLGALAPGQSYADSANLVLPRGIAGPWHLLMRTDLNAEVYEHSAEGNNIRAIPISVSLHPYPDLQVTYLQGPSQGTSGGTAVLQWTVTNAGTGATGSGSWVDRVYYSTDMTYQSGSDQLLATFTHNGGLESGQAYLDSRSVNLPAGLTGLRYFLLLTDASDAIYEHADEGNNLRVAAIEVSAPPPQLPDLVVDALLVPGLFSNGEKKNVRAQWEVRNGGTYPTPTAQSFWSDAFYLSGDDVFDSGDLLLSSVSYTGGLTAGQSYVREFELSTPRGLVGEYFLFVKTDALDRVAETDGGNNVRRIALTLQGVQTDLRVAAVNAPTEALSGQSIHIHWIVENNGAAPTEHDEWYDSVYLSRDGIADDTDYLLATHRHAGELMPEDSYADSVDADVPLGVAGTFFVLVRTDRNDEVEEYQAELNNTSRDPDPVDVLLPDPADLAITEVAIPEAGEPGTPISVGWTVANVGTNPAPDAWTDALYVSADSVWGLSAIRIGEVPHSGGLDPGKEYRGSYQGVLTADLPGLANGSYRIIVRTDLRNNVLEDDELNNIAVSSGVIAVATVELLPGEERSIATEIDGKQYFRTRVGPQSDLRVTVSADGAYDDLQIHVGYGRMPDRIDHDGSYDVTPTRAAVLPGGGGQEIYFMVHCDWAQGSTAYSILVEELPFGFAAVQPMQAGNAGFATFEVSGGQLDSLQDLRLVTAEGASVPAWQTLLSNSARLHATFDLRGAVPGRYDLLGVTAAGDSTRLEGVEIRDGEGSRVVLTIDGMRSIRVDTESDYVVTLRNQGDADAYDVVSSILLVPGSHYALLDREATLTAGIADSTPVLISTREVRIGQTAQYGLRIWSDSDVTLDVVAIDIVPEPITIGRVAAPKHADERSEGRGRDNEALLFSVLRPVVQAFTDALAGAGYPGDPELVLGAVANCYLEEAATTPTAYAVPRLAGALRWGAAAVYSPPPEESAVEEAVSVAVDEFREFADAARDGSYERADLYIRVVRPTDPNAKVGPSGLDDGFVTVDDVLPYTVYFENIPSATSPAHQVRILDPLDVDFDIRRFRLGEVAFGETVLPVPEDVGYWHTLWPLPNGMILEVDAGVDVESRMAHWYLDTIDPETGLAPVDPSLGFLPPNDSTGVGQGRVSFRLQAEPLSPPGTELTNQATIFFDLNEPIVTNTVKSTVREGWPDYVITALDVQSAQVPPLEGEPITLVASVRNVGSESPDSIAVVFLAGDLEGGGEVIGDTLWVPPLAPSGDAEVSRTWAPSRVYGEIDVRVEVDPGDEVLELDESNNHWSAILPLDPRRFWIATEPGIHLFGPPLRPEGGLMASSLAESTNAELIVRLDSTGTFVPWIQDDPESEDFELLGGSAYILVTASSDTTELSGATQDGAVAVRAGYNLVSLPVQPDSGLTARAFATRLGASVVIYQDPEFGGFIPYVPSSQSDDFAIRGGAGYLVRCEGDRTVEFEGIGWNGLPVAGRRGRSGLDPERAAVGSPILAITGAVHQKGRDGSVPLGIPLIAEIENQRSGVRASVKVAAGSGRFAAALIDLAAGDAARAGDPLVVRFRRADGSLVPETATINLQSSDVTRRRVRVDEAVLALPPAVTLVEPVNPNPLRHGAIVRYQLAESRQVTIEVFGVDGRRVQSLVNSVQPAGYYDVFWRLDGEHARIAAGVYFLRFRAEGQPSDQKLVVLR